MHKVKAKGILSAANGMNIYRGCQHGCIYCDARSKCYQMNHRFEDIEVKENAPELLENALKRKRRKCMIGTGAMSDPYIPLEKEHISKEQTAYLRRTQKRKAAVWLLQALLLVLFFLLWEIAADCGWIDPFLFSQPTELFATAVKMIRDGSLFLHIGTTLRETVIGFLLGTILGTLTAVLLWWNRFISDVAEPYLVVLNSLPKTALAPIIIVWFGNNQSSIIIVALLTSIVVTILSVLNGFLQVDEDQIKLIRIFGGTKRQVLTKVVFPANIPCILNALKINVGLSFVGVIVGEFLVAQDGLGFLIVYSSQTFAMRVVLLSVVILAILSALMYRAISLLEKQFHKWQG